MWPGCELSRSYHDRRGGSTPPCRRHPAGCPTRHPPHVPESPGTPVRGAAAEPTTSPPSTHPARP